MTDFSSELVHWIGVRGISMRELERRSGYSVAHISYLAKGQRNPSPDVARDLDQALRADGSLVAAAARGSRRGIALGMAVGSALLQERWPGARVSKTSPDHGVDRHLELPPGRVLDGSGRIAVQLRPLEPGPDGSLVLQSGDGRMREFLAARQRGMLIGMQEIEGAVTVRGLDTRYARARLAGDGQAQAPLTFDDGCELDEFAYALIWAVTSLDDALLADDRQIDERVQRSAPSRSSRSLTASADDEGDLTAAAQMWLGSNLCARHILRSIGRPRDVPVFWTREQSGEEACLWLLFRHKQEYLKNLAARFAGNPAAAPHRGFCVPPDMAATAPKWERILFFLAAALMEATGTHVDVIQEPGYGAVGGFVLLPGSRAIIATWLRAEGACDAGTTSSRAVLREYADVTGHAAVHSVVEAAVPQGRLRVLADYLSLDWTWLTQRSVGLGAGGCGRLVRPRSRLLSLAGIDEALRFVGAMGQPGDGQPTRR
jgi:transcriptional regulator with XRE-family HTH domain